MRRGIFRGIIILALASLISMVKLPYKLEKRLYKIQICEVERFIDDIEPKKLKDKEVYHY